MNMDALRQFCHLQLKLIPELHYGDPDCKIPVRDDYPKDQLLFFEIELVDFMTVRVSSSGWLHS